MHALDDPHDLVVLGGGTAGLVAAVGSAALGARVTLVERDRTGGDCLWTGCVPSKALLQASRVVHAARTADDLGLGTAELDVDLARVMSRVHAAQHTIAPHDSPERLEREGVRVVSGHGRLDGPGRVEVDTAEGPVGLRTRATLLATGSSPVLPPVDGLAETHPLTTDTVWGLTELPRRLVVLGGGPVGCELGQAFARLGSHVTLVQIGERILSKEEPETSDLLARVLREEGVDLRVSTRAVRVEDSEDGLVLVVARPDGVEERLRYDRLLVAAGRRPDTSDLGLDTVGIATTDAGHVVVDDTMRTTANGVLAAGDVTGTLPFTHVAAAQGALVVTNALFSLRRSFDAEVMPWATYVDPEVGRVGPTVAEARQRHGDDVQVARFELSSLDRGIAAEETTGFVTLVAGRRGRVLGGTVVAPSGGDVIAAVTAWVRQGASLSDVGQTTVPYPSFGELPVKAASEVLRERWLSPRTRRLARPALRVLRRVSRPWATAG